MTRLCYVQRLPASVGRDGLSGRLLVDHLRRQYEVTVCDGVFDSAPVMPSAAHMLASDFVAQRFDAVYMEGGAFWGSDADAAWKVPEALLRSYVAGGGVLVVADVGRGEMSVGRNRKDCPYERAPDLFGVHFDWGDDESSLAYGADEVSNWNGGFTSVIAAREPMVYEPWLEPAYKGIDQVLALQPLVLHSLYGSTLITGNHATGETLRNDFFVDLGGPFTFGIVQQIELGFVVFIAAAVSHDVVIEANPDNARWMSNIVSFLVDEASRERDRRGLRDPLQGSRALQHREWAAELGRLAELHNDVELRMRALIHSTLASEERARGERGWAEREILAAIRSKEHSRVGSGSPDQLLARLYWIELIAIIGRQWRLFARAFGDLQELRAKARIVNDRPFAHAKPLDVADLALYRRELSWFRTKLEQSMST
jgi:hypothetical protein